MSQTHSINDKVIVNCPVYKNGKSHNGIVKSVKIHDDGQVMGYKVLIDGNVKDTFFWAGWVAKK
jgi:hypothetical protein